MSTTNTTTDIELDAMIAEALRIEVCTNRRNKRAERFTVEPARNNKRRRNR